MKNVVLLLLMLAALLARSTPGRAQSVGIGTATPNASAALDIKASDRGLLIPRLTAAQRTAITAPPQGLMVYQTDGTPGGGPQTGFWYYAGTPAAWVFLNPTGGGADNLGNHTATQALNLGPNPLTGSGASVGTAVGVGVRADGGLNLGQNTTGNNVFLGYQAGATTTGSFNTFSGYQAGAAATTGSFDTFSGYQAGARNTTGNYNLFSGYQSGYSNTTGSNNTFSGGFRSGFYNTTGGNNTFNGTDSGFNNSTGSNNVFSGYSSGFFNRTGSNNLFNGYQSGYNNSTSSNNQFSGYQSGYNNTTGDQNQFSGYQSGYVNTTGFRNLFVGYQSGISNTTGSRNWAFGYLAGPNATNLTNAGAIGYQATVSQSNSLALGGTGVFAVNVGIGTSRPSQRLEVNGNILATGTVNMGWTQLSGTYTLPGHIQATYTLTCPNGTRALGGGGGHRDDNIGASNIAIYYSGPDPADPEHKWRVILGNSANNDRAVRVYCNCARIAP
ncbi:hypothetical protein [Hymenobacter negativus]|uniref:Uncharacterized protein n=1 Tax=Hymenobacter negativus TaxID=2795026 RepID=A0ABS3QDE8_9BACT|nr:hypothetical protein [Hymenobacter negativus]MBO2009141.1 hypothetical protein [Hymenobacter negativus]